MKYFTTITLLAGLLMLAAAQFTHAPGAYAQGEPSLPMPWITPAEGGVHAFSDPFPIIVDFRVRLTEGEIQGNVALTLATLDGVDLLPHAATTDSKRWRISIPSISSGRHTLIINAQDEAGNTFAEDVEIKFRVLPRPAFILELFPGWNLISLPASPENPAIDVVFRPNTPVGIVLSFDPTVPGGWLAATRRALPGGFFGPFVGDLTTVDANHGYWVFSGEQTEIGVFIPTHHSGVGSQVPITPSVISIHQGWNLVPVADITGDLEDGDVIDSDVYFASLDDEISRISTFDPVTSRTLLVARDGVQELGTQEQLTTPGARGACATCPLSLEERVQIGRAYWVFSSEDGTLVP